MATSSDQAYDAIRRRILDGTAAAGSRLVEADLARELDSSRTPVREALRRLEAEGLVEVLPHRGARVTEWTLEELRDLYDLRATLEGLAARRAAVRIEPETLSELTAQCAAMEQCLSDPSPAARDRYSALNNDFHDLVRRAAGSNQLLAMLHTVVRVPLVTVTFHRFEDAHIRRSAAHHRELVDALRTGDGEWAAAVMRAHVLAAKATLLKE